MFIFVIWWITNIIITSYFCLIFGIWKEFISKIIFLTTNITTNPISSFSRTSC